SQPNHPFSGKARKKHVEQPTSPQRVTPLAPQKNKKRIPIRLTQLARAKPRLWRLAVPRQQHDRPMRRRECTRGRMRGKSGLIRAEHARSMTHLRRFDNDVLRFTNAEGGP